MNPSRLRTVFSFGIILLSAGLLQAQLINVDFNNDSGGSAHGGPGTGPTMSGAAVLGTAGDQWNGISVSSGSGISLANADGSSSSVKMTFTSGGGYDAYSYSGSTPFAGTSYDALMEDYLFNSGVAQTITLSGLATNSAYLLVLYNAADAGATAPGRQTFFTVNGNTQSSVWNATSSALIAGVDYVKFTSALSDGSGNLVITYTGNGSAEGDIDGFQIQFVPKPAPTVAITNPVSGAVFVVPGSAGISASALISSGTVTNVQFFTNGASMGSILTAPFSLTVSNLNAGAYALTAVATAAGISTTSTVVSVTVVTPPSAPTNSAAAFKWTTLAGHTGEGSSDGVGSTAQFYGPEGAAVDSAGNVYVADTYNNTIRKITPAGLVSTVAGFAGASGTNDGVGGAARFNSPASVAVDGAGNLYVADTVNYTIRKITPVGTNWMVTTIAGNNNILTTNNYGFTTRNNTNPVMTIAYVGGSADGTNTAAQFKLPLGIAVDSATNLYVADTYNNTIRKITPLGTNWVVSTLAGLAGDTNGNYSGSADGTNRAARFNLPAGIAVDSATNIYVADSGNNTIRKIVASGTNWVVSTIAGTVANNGGYADGLGIDTQFNLSFDPLPTLTMDGSGNLYVADEGNNVIRKITPVPASPTHGFLWQVTTFAGQVGANGFGSANGVGTNAQFSNPAGIAADSAGNLYVSDYVNNEIRKITTAAVVSTLAGFTGGQGSADGNGSGAQFNQPFAAAVDLNGNVFVADTENDLIREITSLGQVSTVAGLAGSSGSADGTNNTARFEAPYGIAVDGADNLYVADSGNATIRKITPADVVTTLAGLAGNRAANDGTNNGARFNFPRSLALDGAGNIYVADQGNYTIRKISPVGANWVVSTLAGLAGSQGTQDGTGSAARFFTPQGIAVDRTTNVYVADQFNTTPIIRKLTLSGTNWVVSTISAVGGNSVAVDGAGNLYVADLSTINEISPVGNNWRVSIIGGAVNFYGSADGVGNVARFSGPADVAVDSGGNLFVPDYFNNNIRQGVFTAYGAANEVAYSPPLMNGQLTVTLLPANAAGQWRFPWEVAWRNSGQTASNLVADNYPVEFRNVPGWLPIPPILTNAVTNGGTTQITNQYYPTISAVDTNIGGILTVTLGSAPPAGAGWRFLGDATPFYPSGYSTNLVAGTYLLQFAAVSGRVTPPNLSVQVQAGLTTSLAENYLLAGAAPAQMALPVLVPPASLGDLADYPFGFNGQLQTDTGYGSGVAVETNVVLTAAHLVFNDQTLAYVSQAWWYFQRESSVLEPEPLTARGWYVLSGYAAQRTNDLTVYAPDTSTPQSRNLDVAALYFLSPVAGGGDGGYLPSDISPNPWLTGSSLKMLVGYPVDGSEFGDASISTNAGEMYQISPQPYPFSLATDPVNDQQVYTASWFLSYPGNSGGPVYVQLNGYYYPAGVYLGTLYNGITPSASAVRAIDSNVVNLIISASALGDTGTNHSGGGVITIIPSLAVSQSNPGYLILQLGPPSAVQAGAAWKLASQPVADYSTANPSLQEVTSANALVLQFKPVPGWIVPTNQTVTVVPGPILTNSAIYTVTNPVLVAGNSAGLGLSGTPGTVYRIDRRTSLTSGSWLPVSTNTILTNGFNLILPQPNTNGNTFFYRAVWLGQ